MCISPNFVWIERGSEWVKNPKPCGDCWRCKQNRLNDYVARCLAEAATSSVSCTLTLTYADRDDLADKVVHPRHFQLFMKLLRRAGHKVRYLVAGEYGELKDRAHFHAILFFQDLVPLVSVDDEGFETVRGVVPFYNSGHLLNTVQSGPFCREIPHKRMVHIREWPHGHVKCDWSASEKSARYVCKYLLADDKNNAWFSLSKKPALGAAWFAKKALTAKELGVLPSSFEYLPPGGSKDRPYLMTGATRRDFVNAITSDPSDRERMSEWVRKTFDKHHYARLRERWETGLPDDLEQVYLDWEFCLAAEQEAPELLRISREFLRENKHLLRAFNAEHQSDAERVRYDSWVKESLGYYVEGQYPLGGIGFAPQGDFAGSGGE